MPNVSQTIDWHQRARDKSLHAFDKYTEPKTTWIELV
jgi:hypothetical protein